MEDKPNKFKLVAESKSFNYFILFLIITTSILIGIDTYHAVATRYGHIINIIDATILGLFVVELIIRIAAEGRTWWRYFQDPWNVFDFAIVSVCLLPVHSQTMAVFRLVRVLRVLRLLKTLPRLRMIINGMITSLRSLGYIALLLFIHFYIFAVLGVYTFSKTDPVHFGTLQGTFLTLFQLVTLENWPDVMSSVRGAFPIGAPAYFVVFILLGTMVIMNLFVGAIVSSMSEAFEEVKRSAAVEAAQQKLAGKDPGHSMETIAAKLDKLHEEVLALSKHVGEIRSQLPS